MREHPTRTQDTHHQTPAIVKHTQEESGAVPMTLDPASIMRLQSEIGNQAVLRMIAQRDDTAAEATATETEEEVTNPLSPARVALAISYYRQRRRDYTPEIIRQMQEQLNAIVGPIDVDGIIGPQTVQAVARYQLFFNDLPNTRLAATDDRIDGMAGPRTLPALFPQGLANGNSIREYAESAQEIEENWGDLGDSQSRINELTQKVQDQLNAANVPNVRVIVIHPDDDPNDQMDASTLGLFDWETWEMSINPVPFERDEVTTDQFMDMANTVYHEARHAEQFYRIAQMLAGQGKTAAEIFDETRILQEVCDQAVTEPLAPGSMEALIADGWYQSVFGSGAAHRNQVLTDPGAAHEDYLYLPEETDAWHIGDEFDLTYRNLGEEEESTTL